MLRKAIFPGLMLTAASLGAQTPPAPANPMSAALLRSFATVSDYIVRSAEQLPDEKYGFQPTAEVRTFAKEIGHVADAHFVYCARARNEASPQQARAENTLTEKAALVARLKESVAYCRDAYSTVTDTMLGQAYQVGNATGLRLTALVTNIGHDNEHYGKIVTYLRLNGMVPPSSQPR
jgi:uncharacterized damage-inducible protein DinB